MTRFKIIYYIIIYYGIKHPLQPTRVVIEASGKGGQSKQKLFEDAAPLAPVRLGKQGQERQNPCVNNETPCVNKPREA